MIVLSWFILCFREALQMAALGHLYCLSSLTLSSSFHPHHLIHQNLFIFLIHSHSHPLSSEQWLPDLGTYHTPMLNFLGSGTGIWTQGFKLGKQARYHLNHNSAPFFLGYFGDRVSWTICLGWPQTVMILISASQVTRIIGISHQSLDNAQVLMEMNSSHQVNISYEKILMANFLGSAFNCVCTGIFIFNKTWSSWKQPRQNWA
jgi:hypothetical protein